MSRAEKSVGVGYWLVLFFAFLMYIFLMTLVYNDVMKDDHKQTDIIKKNRRFSILYVSAMVLLSIVMIYFVVSLFACAHHYKRDTQMMRTYRKLNKKVKDMSALQKKNYYQYQHAKHRMRWYTCGPFMASAKIGTILSSIGAFFLYPYVKEKKTDLLFILLCVLLTPAMLIFSVSTIFIIGNFRTYSYY